MAWKKEKKNHRKENVLLAYTEALQPQPEIVIISEKPGKEEDARQITAQNIHLTPKKERKRKMTYKNREGYPDPTSGQAMQRTHWEELQQLREKEHNLRRGQKFVIAEMCRDEMHKTARAVKKTYTVIELYKHCVLLENEKGTRSAPSYPRLQSLMRGGANGD